MKEINGLLKADALKICLVASRFNDFLTKELVGGAVDCFVRHAGKEGNITLVRVPGSDELPMAVQRVVSTGGFNAVIALGVVIQGATKHADLIVTQVSRSLSGIAMSSNIPVINGVVAADNLEQAIERCGTKAGNKGWAATQAAIEMADVYRQLG